MKLSVWLDLNKAAFKVRHQMMDIAYKKMGSNMPNTWSEYWDAYPEEFAEIEMAERAIPSWEEVEDLPGQELIDLANRYAYAGWADNGQEDHWWDEFVRAGGDRTLYNFIKNKGLLLY